MASQYALDPSIISKIKKLSLQDRLSIVEDIWGSILLSNEDLPISEKRKTDLDKRYQDYQNNPQKGASWEDVKKRIESKI